MQPPVVTVFIPCLVDQVLPEIGKSLIRLLRHFGYSPRYNPNVTCCGQPAFNAGRHTQALSVARKLVDEMSGAEGPIICPSGSCTAMVQRFYGHLFQDDERNAEAQKIGERVIEFSQFAIREGWCERMPSVPRCRVGLHSSCHTVRELGITREPVTLLRSIEGVDLVDSGEPTCCGFGGLFSATLPHVARGMARSRLETFTDRSVEILVSNDPGCILHLRQVVRSLGVNLDVLHLTEFLARSIHDRTSGGEA